MLDFNKWIRSGDIIWNWLNKKNWIKAWGATQRPALSSGHICQFMESESGSGSFHLEVSFCFVASLSKCMSSPFYFGQGFDFWSAIICPFAQYPWEITPSSQDADKISINFCVAPQDNHSVTSPPSVLSTTSACCCTAAVALTELGDLSQPPSLLLIPAEI